MIAPPADPDKAQVQRLVVYGYTLNCCRHFVLHVNDAAKARNFLAALVRKRFITNASIDNDDVDLLNDRGYCPINVGFSFRGLEALELAKPYLRVFQEKARAFAEGANPRAAQHLADTGAGAAQWWDACFQAGYAHVLLSLHAEEESELDAGTDALRAIPDAAGLDGWNAPTRLEGRHLATDRKKRTVHFGFRDGIANPAVKGFHPDDSVPKPHAAGEFVLGYKNNEEFNPWLLVNPRPQPNPWLLPLAHIDPEFFWNGSFAALRKMEQHEREFREFVADCATRRGVAAEYVKAKLAGRWEDGSVVQPGAVCAPVSSAEAAGTLEPANQDAFDFSNDLNGEGCPFGAHIRRMNPRTDPIVPFRRRPLIRRGMPYGPSFDAKPGKARGLLGLFFCASLEDQFEHLLAEWGDANPMGPDNRGNAKDPLIGNHESPRAIFDIPVPDETLCGLDGFTPFVTTRGTMYAFYPSLKALGMIAGIGAPAS